MYCDRRAPIGVEASPSSPALALTPGLFSPAPTRAEAGLSSPAPSEWRGDISKFNPIIFAGLKRDDPKFASLSKFNLEARELFGSGVFNTFPPF
jgi:hypothetical protein